MDHVFVDRFGAVASDYAAFRPSYPAALYAWLASVVEGHELAWDCATGNGQAARGLSGYFAQVIATDASADQIRAAATSPGIQFRVAGAEESGLAPASVDLITVAQALHWLDRGRFFGECARVLKPQGVLAVWTYGPLHVEDESIDAQIQRYYYDIVGRFWPPERVLVDGGYQSIALPFPELEVPRFEMSVNWSLEQLFGYLGTWSSTSAYRQARQRDPRELIRRELSAVWGETASVRRVIWPLTVRAARSDGSICID